MIRIYEITSNKTDYMELLLLGDEQEEMIMKYLDRGRLYVMKKDDTVCAVCVVTDEGDFTLELKNIAVAEQFQRQGLGRELILFIENRFAGAFRKLILGTGDSPLTVPFYEKCGFRKCGVIKNFFIDNYDHPIYEAGVQLCDMICFEKELSDNYGTDREVIAEIR
ncbi:GNAT family N-acetyltransferase [Ruminococcus flavefaciens]|uniref:Acetyltransferase (GNAT) domain-containing protein n=1 Tax=Ruminococcus flavefaciens TaxID=1265 RepID=A0A1K1LUQ3_RUMFL|nr:GNAT family N-acetyltransferase [Ruminococcus flavefaciens]SFW14653.1 Acetyltransferase (GNAT) domain-containing protein [Ruminococcus flavefaciens]